MTFVQTEIIKLILSILVISIMLGSIAHYYDIINTMIVISIPIGLYLGYHFQNNLKEHYE